MAARRHRGEPANLYPWGPEGDPRQEPWRANTVESALLRSTAVGLYPLGASKAGLLDMAGTIWEWCLNSFEDPVAEFSSKQWDRRTVRGGSWSSFPAYARCAARYGFNPDDRDAGTGFRVVCSPPISDR